MRPIVFALVCFLGMSTGTAHAAEPKRLTTAEVEKELALAEGYITRDRGKPPVDATTGETVIGRFAVSGVVENIGRQPEGSPLRLKAIALARKYAAIPEYAVQENLKKQKRPEGVDDHQAHARLHFAWGVLRETHVLRDGMRLEEVIALLGPPTKTGPEFAEWYYSSGMHVNPCLRWRVDGRTKGSIQVTRY